MVRELQESDLERAAEIWPAANLQARGEGVDGNTGEPEYTMAWERGAIC